MNPSYVKKKPKKKLHVFKKFRNRTVYLSNVPENATIKNINGAVRQMIGKFRAMSCTFMPNMPGTVELVLKDREATRKLVDATFINIFGVIVDVSRDLKKAVPERYYYPVYVRGLPPNMKVKTFLGIARKIVGDFVAMNKVSIDENGFSKITFQSQRLQARFLENCNVEDLQLIEASLNPFRRNHAEMNGHGNHADSFNRAQNPPRPRQPPSDLYSLQVMWKDKFNRNLIDDIKNLGISDNTPNIEYSPRFENGGHTPMADKTPGKLRMETPDIETSDEVSDSMSVVSYHNYSNIAFEPIYNSKCVV